MLIQLVIAIDVSLQSSLFCRNNSPHSSPFIDLHALSFGIGKHSAYLELDRFNFAVFFSFINSQCQPLNNCIVLHVKCFKELRATKGIVSKANANGEKLRQLTDWSDQ